jgi:hypothetical protein
VAALAACENGPRPDAVSQRLLDRYDIEAAGSTTTQRMVERTPCRRDIGGLLRRMLCAGLS